MKVSVVIITRNRPELLSKSLSSILKASKVSSLEFEFICLINGSDPRSSSAIKQFPDERVQLLEVHEPLLPAEARNQALSRCRGEWVYFADDDIVVKEDFFRQFNALRTEHPNVDVIGGPNLTPADSALFQLASGYALGSTLGSAKCVSRYRLDSKKHDCEESHLILCNLFVRTSLVKIHAFPPDYICAEENHAFTMWKKTGAIFLYDPELAVDHVRRSDVRGFAAQIFKYGRGRGRLIAKGSFSWFHVVPLGCVCLVLSAFFFESMRASVGALCLIYSVLLISESIKIAAREKRHALFPLALLAFVTIHLSYAFGVAKGSLSDSFR